MASRLVNQLVLTLTHDCNLRCSFCPLELNSNYIDLYTAVKSISIYKEQFQAPYHIRFFGGEPLLRFDLIESLVNDIDSFSFPTNGTLINQKIISFLQNHPNIEVSISHERDLNIIKQLPSAIVNINIYPEKVEDLTGLVASFLLEGITKFNFLPRFFTVWEDIQLEKLEESLMFVAELIKDWQKNGTSINIRNKSICNEVPVFNQGIVIDTNGEIFPSNAFLCKIFKDFRKEFLIGDIYSEINWGKSKNINWQTLFQKSLTPEEYSSTLYLNEILLDFVDHLGR